VISSGKKILAFLPLYRHEKESGHEFTSNFSFICEPTLHADLSPIEKKHFAKILINKIVELFNQFEIVKFDFKINPSESDINISDWHEGLLKNLAVDPQIQYAASLNLETARLPSKKFIRKSYRSLINSGLKTWKHIIINKETLDRDFWNSFIELHINSAGRRTRSEETWEYQFDLIRRDLAYSIGLYDPISNDLVGAAFYQHNSSEALYATAAYDRALFHKPLGHVIQWISINYALNKGLKSVCFINDVRFNVEEIATQKEQRIQFFKLGFCNQVKPVFILKSKDW
jgi:FemAB family protein